MAINNFIVSRIINEALQRVNQSGRYRTVLQALEAAWAQVNSRRLRGDCSENLAAAEHYLFARYMTAQYGVFYYPAMNSMTWSYDMYKNLLNQFGGEVSREGSCPPSQPSAEIRDWAYRGSLDGLNDALGLSHVGSLGAPPNPNQSSDDPAGQVGDAISPNIG